MKLSIRGQVYEGERSKLLMQELPMGSIALLWHEDLDSLTTDALLEKKVKAVINRKRSMSGRYEHGEVSRLLEAGIAVFDVANWVGASYLLKNESVWIMNNRLYLSQNDTFAVIAELDQYDEQRIEELRLRAQTTYQDLLTNFVSNTLEHANREAEYFVAPPLIPSCFQQIKSRQVLIVARHAHYKRDLKAMRRWLVLTNPLIIAVDGAADGLLEVGFLPEYIIGDMDSVSDKALQCGAQLICHTYPDGSSPGMERLRTIGIEASELSFIGTSEDVAIMSAYWAGAEHLYLIGCRSGMKDFLEKQRNGMGSSVLARIEAGDRMTDLKGIHQLFEGTTFSSQMQRINHDLKEEWTELRDIVGRGYRLLLKKGAIRHD
ncbi:putative cytokinetic ring protein SteA [Alkalicoccobacillus murimartini]|uniref:Membrane-anchored protein n=1 Tax=Alkalicoccobacillus murimartini TaxID=171685 RepID=A0ABT9YM39_9BACI|nr:putative cytokinetic ring protein SteA [Alkalicoccobacillus murimartini]MDQ0208922.1 putative membrane-anchored protein [Alkalicoccobacillus murimartini]